MNEMHRLLTENLAKWEAETTQNMDNLQNQIHSLAHKQQDLSKHISDLNNLYTNVQTLYQDLQNIMNRQGR